MSRVWQERANLRAVARLLVVFGAIIGGFTGLAATKSDAGFTRYWIDAQLGFAMGGYDPVAYFVEDGPRIGKPGLEYTWGGAFWRFSNQGNRAAFMKDPEVYAPRFGGYDPIGVARGTPTEGSPHVWAIYKGQLLLFHSPALKALWQMDPTRTLADARTKWPDIPSTASFD